MGVPSLLPEEEEGEMSLCHHCVFIVFKSVGDILISVGGNFSLTLFSLWMDDSSINRIKVSMRVFILVQSLHLLFSLF